MISWTAFVLAIEAVQIIFIFIISLFLTQDYAPGTLENDLVTY